MGNLRPCSVHGEAVEKSSSLSELQLLSMRLLRKVEMLQGGYLKNVQFSFLLI